MPTLYPDPSSARAYQALLEKQWRDSGLFTPDQRALMAKANYDPARIGDLPLPPLLEAKGGEPTLSPMQWSESRRPALLRQFEALIYGQRLPDASVEAEITEQSADALEGLAHRLQVVLHTAGHRLHLIVYRPAGHSRPVPCFLGMNFQGNHAAFVDPAIPLSDRWMAPRVGVVHHRATEAARGVNRSAWPVEMILRRGYALATLYYGDAEPDHPGGFSQGIRSRLLTATCDTHRHPQDAGSLTAWAWGLSRAMDYLLTLPELDPRRICLTGHSRLGKAALWASALDDRFAGVIANNSGCAGAAPNRRNYGESLAILCGVRPYWFAPACAAIAHEAHTLPIDQHMLIALSAPRPVLISCAQDDLAADPIGEFESACATDPVYRLLGVEGLSAETAPLPGSWIPSRLGYWLRQGPHAITAEDWQVHLDFADRHLR